jgi:hypothetical protein
MNEGFAEINPPPGLTSSVTANLVMNGPWIPPQQRILLYSAEEWETLIQEWVHFSLKRLYVQVQRFTGAGDRGIDIAGFVDAQRLEGVWDNYQCKKYSGHPLYPSDAWPEIGKILWYSFNGEYRPPRRYYFVASRGIGTTLAGYLSNASRLKTALIQNWNGSVKNAITDKQEVPLDGEFLKYVQAFDFSIFDSKTALQVIEGHRDCPNHSARFGGGLPIRPEAEKPPVAIAAGESRYIAQLLEAYADHKKQPVPDVKKLRTWSALDNHFQRQREAFYHAESLRVFARDSVPAGTFQSLQNDIHSGVVDVCDSNHADGFERVKEVTRAAREMQITSNALLTCSNPKDRDGICHQLANEDRLLWVKS